MTESRRNRPFSNGTEYGMWDARNCQRCKKYVPDSTTPEEGCDIEFAIASGLFGDGTVDEKFIDRIGGYDGSGIWLVDCQEWEATS